MCSATLWARNVSSRWLGCARGTTLSTAFALPANWTRMAPPLRPPGRRLRRVTSAPTTLATSSRTSAGSSSGWVPWLIGSKGRSPLGWLVPPCSAGPGPTWGPSERTNAFHQQAGFLVDLSDNGFGQKLTRFDNTSRRSPYLDLCAGLTYEEHPIGSTQDRRHGHDTLTPRHLGTVDQPHEAAGINRLNHRERAPREPADL